MMKQSIRSDSNKISQSLVKLPKNKSQAFMEIDNTLKQDFLTYRVA
jgi:hypothetical protein